MQMDDNRFYNTEKREMSRTSFLNNYMEKLKKYRKRQQKRKTIICKPANAQEKNEESMYIFLPIVSREFELDSYEIGQSRIVGKAKIARINLFEAKNDSTMRMTKSKTFSLGEKRSGQSQEYEHFVNYEEKVQQLINDIKYNRNRPNKMVSYLSEQSLQPQESIKPEQSKKVLPSL